MLFGDNGNSYTISPKSDMFIYTRILNNMEMLVG